MTRTQPSVTSQLLPFAHRLADEAGAAILPHFRRKLTIDNKAVDGGYDPVTAADRAAERVIRRLVKTQFPEHGLLGEEYGSERQDASWQWIVDPIDGTRAFVLGLPLWGTLIGLTHDGQAVLGIMDQPYTRERFWSAGRNSYFRGPEGRQRRVRVRPCAALADAMLTTTHPDLFAAGTEQRGFRRVKERVRACRYGGDCYAYCLLAAGHIDVIVEAGLKPFDIAALIPIIEQAGGQVTSWDGGPAGRGGRIVATGDPRVHDEVLRTLA